MTQACLLVRRESGNNHRSMFIVYFEDNMDMNNLKGKVKLQMKST